MEDIIDILPDRSLLLLKNISENTKKLAKNIILERSMNKTTSVDVSGTMKMLALPVAMFYLNFSPVDALFNNRKFPEQDGTLFDPKSEKRESEERVRANDKVSYQSYLERRKMEAIDEFDADAYNQEKTPAPDPTLFLLGQDENGIEVAIDQVGRRSDASEQFKNIAGILRTIEENPRGGPAITIEEINKQNIEYEKKIERDNEEFLEILEQMKTGIEEEIQNTREGTPSREYQEEQLNMVTRLINNIKDRQEHSIIEDLKTVLFYEGVDNEKKKNDGRKVKSLEEIKRDARENTKRVEQINAKIADLERDVKEFKKRVESNDVSEAELDDIELDFYGMPKSQLLVKTIPPSKVKLRLKGVTYKRNLTSEDYVRMYRINRAKKLTNDKINYKNEDLTNEERTEEIKKEVDDLVKILDKRGGELQKIAKKIERRSKVEIEKIGAPKGRERRAMGYKLWLDEYVKSHIGKPSKFMGIEYDRTSEFDSICYEAYEIVIGVLGEVFCDPSLYKEGGIPSGDVGKKVIRRAMEKVKETKRDLDTQRQKDKYWYLSYVSNAFGDVKNKVHSAFVSGFNQIMSLLISMSGGVAITAWESLSWLQQYVVILFGSGTVTYAFSSMVQQFFAIVKLMLSLNVRGIFYSIVDRLRRLRGVSETLTNEQKVDKLIEKFKLLRSKINSILSGANSEDFVQYTPPPSSVVDMLKEFQNFSEKENWENIFNYGKEYEPFSSLSKEQKIQNHRTVKNIIDKTIEELENNNDEDTINHIALSYEGLSIMLDQYIGDYSNSTTKPNISSNNTTKNSSEYNMFNEPTTNTSQYQQDDVESDEELFDDILPPPSPRQKYSYPDTDDEDSLPPPPDLDNLRFVVQAFEYNLKMIDYGQKYGLNIVFVKPEKPRKLMRMAWDIIFEPNKTGEDRVESVKKNIEKAITESQTALYAYEEKYITSNAEFYSLLDSEVIEDIVVIES